MNTLEILEQRLIEMWPVTKWSNLTIVVACSGGADSTALAVAIQTLAPATSRVLVAHYNHALRGEHSDGDEAFVGEMANSLGLAYFSRRATEQRSDEASFRNDRYEFLLDVARTNGARYVVTAHTADDQAETVIHRICRGAGLRGLGGITPFRSLPYDLVLARPLLHVWRSDVIEYLNIRGKSYRRDASNESTMYTRNRIRHRVIPLMEQEIHSHTKQNIVQTAEQLQAAHRYIARQTSYHRECCVQVKQDSAIIALPEFERIDDFIASEVLRQVWEVADWPLRDMTVAHWLKLRQLLKLPEVVATQQDWVFPGNVHLVITGGTATLTRR